MGFTEIYIYMVRRLNLCERWIKGVDECFSSVSVSILVSLDEEFPMRKGVRQGDPLTPFLFLIVAEGTGLVRKAMELKKLVGVKVGESEKVEVAILQFADDTLMLRDASLQNVLSLKSEAHP